MLVADGKENGFNEEKGMKGKGLVKYLGIGAIVLLFAFTIGRGIGNGSDSGGIGAVEKLGNRIWDKLDEQVLGICVAGLEPGSKEAAMDDGQEKNVGSPRLNIDSERAELLVTDGRGGELHLGYADKETFLKDFGFEGEPFYQYVDEESGALWMELYFDEEAAKGCGIRYFPDEGRKEAGFVFNCSYKPLYLENDYILRGNDKEEIYSKLTYDGYDPSKDMWIEDFQEQTEYTADGKMKHYIATGWMTDLGDEKVISTLVEMNFVYREDGTLQRKDRSHNFAYGGTWHSIIHSCYDKQERLVFEDCYVTHGSVDYYYIYEGDEKKPAYYLVIDHNLSDLYAEMYSCHDVTGEENGKCYGKIGPDLSENAYVQAVRKANETMKYNGGSVSHTYCMDYDGDGKREAFVIIGEYRDWLSGEPGEDFIEGSAWFVDSEKRAVYLDTAAFRTYQEYVWQDGKGYLFLHHSVGLSWETDIYTAKDDQPCEIFTGRTALLDEDEKELSDTVLLSVGKKFLLEVHPDKA